MKRATAAVAVALLASGPRAQARPLAGSSRATETPSNPLPVVRSRLPLATQRAKNEDAPRWPPADVELSLDAPSARGPWAVRITNAGDVPIRVLADARLLSLDVTPRSAATPRRCELPADMRPADALERSLVLPPKRVYVETLEPRLYCFAGKSLDALSSGAIVVARLGRAGLTEGPVAAPIDGVKPEVDERKFLDSPPVRLPDEPTARPLAAVGTDASGLSLVGTETVDALTSEGIEIPLTLRNGGSRPLIVRFRPEMLRFDVVRSSGTERCAWPVVTAAPTPELFARLPAKGRTAELVVDLGAYCMGSVLDRGGLLTVWPRLDTRSGSGESIGIRSFDGLVAGAFPTFVRLHRGRMAEPLGHPRVLP